MYRLIKRFLFLFPPESIHGAVMGFLKFICGLPGGKKLIRWLFAGGIPVSHKELLGHRFRAPVGLAAGFDKNAKYLDILDCLGFGFVEIGTVTPQPQPGNDRPRLFRLPADEALINRMGFNNDGAETVAGRLKNRPPGLIIGGNIGRNKSTPNEEAAEDYINCFNILFDVVDYFVVNVSSPNTPGLRDLQEKAPLKQLLASIQHINQQHKSPKSILLKISPDLTEHQLDVVIEIAIETKIAGIVATNTSLNRKNLVTDSRTLDTIGAGGLSGRPLREISTAFIRHIHQKSGGQLIIVASGGVFTSADAREKLEAGASLVQLYTGFIYVGPGIVRKICKGLDMLKAH